MTRLFIEVRAAEGGDDSKQLVHEMTSLYAKAAAASQGHL